jgi:eukaryotic-like serine/threonine-protein kinase
MTVGERVAGKYELRRLLGEGAMGAVYEGVHVDLGKRLAIKVIRKEFSENPEIAARFRREARAASAVESEYIAQIFDFGRDEQRGLYMVIEYLEGEDLEMRLGRERWIGERETATIGIHVARGLAKAHAAGIVHRDLKPANIFLTRLDDGSLLAKILDFGVSKYESHDAGATAEPTLTELGTTLGTPQYMSPEQCVGKLALDGRTDVWSLCAVLYEMIAGEPAIPGGGGHIAAMQRIVRQGVAPLASRASWASEKLARIIDAGLVRDRNQRIPDASTLAARLLEEYPDAVSHPSMSSGLGRQTDVSALLATRAAWVSTLVDEAPSAETLEANAATLPRASGLAEQEDAIATAAPPAPGGEATRDSSEPPNEEDVEVFSRNSGGLPSELLALRSKRQRS